LFISDLLISPANSLDAGKATEPAAKVFNKVLLFVIVIDPRMD